MSDANAPAPVPAPAPRRRGRLGCYLALGLAGFLLLLAVALLAQVVRMANWVKRGAEPAPRPLPPLRLSPGEETELTAMREGYLKCHREKKDFEALLTPAQINVLADEGQTRKRAKGETVYPFRLSFAGGKFELRGTAPAPNEPDKFWNFTLRGDLEIRDGKVAHWQVDSMTLAGEEPPAGALTVARRAIAEQLRKVENGEAPGKEDLKRIKLLKREGDRLRLILDGRDLPPPIE
jgi:hypothetical protein